MHCQSLSLNLPQLSVLKWPKSPFIFNEPLIYYCCHLNKSCMGKAPAILEHFKGNGCCGQGEGNISCPLLEFMGGTWLWDLLWKSSDPPSLGQWKSQMHCYLNIERVWETEKGRVVMWNRVLQALETEEVGACGSGQGWCRWCLCGSVCCLFSVYVNIVWKNKIIPKQINSFSMVSYLPRELSPAGLPVLVKSVNLAVNVNLIHKLQIAFCVSFGVLQK